MDVESKEEIQPKTRMELLKKEKIECVEIIRSLLIERDISILLGEIEDIDELNTQMSSISKRQIAIDKLILKEELRLDNKMMEDFPAHIMISNKYFS
jgi:hypothetical protein